MSGLSACSSEDVLENVEETTKYAAKREVDNQYIKFNSILNVYNNEKS